MCLAFHWYPTDDCFIIGGKVPEVGVWYFDENLLKKAHGHTNVNRLPWAGWLDGGRKAMSTNSHQTILWNCTDYKNPNKW